MSDDAEQRALSHGSHPLSDDTTFRCPCHQPAGTGAKLVGCDRCGTWQHLSCAGFMYEEEAQDVEYLCDECDRQWTEKYTRRILAQSIEQISRPQPHPREHEKAARTDTSTILSNVPRGRFKKSEHEAVPKPSSTHRSLAEQLFPESEDEAVPKPSTIHDPIVIGSSQIGHDTQLSQAGSDYGSDFRVEDLTEPNPPATRNKEQKKRGITESSQFGHDTQLSQAGSDYGSDFRVEDLNEPNPPAIRSEEQKKRGITQSSQFGYEGQRSPPDADFGSDFRVEDITEFHAGDISETNPSSHRKEEQRNRRKVIIESSESEAEVDAERRSPLATRGRKKVVIESSESESNAQRSRLGSDHDTDVLSDMDVVEASPAFTTSKPSKKKKSANTSDPYQSSSKHTRPSRSRRLKDIHSDPINPPPESTGPRKHKAQPVLSSASLTELEVEMSPYMQNLKRWNTAIGGGGAGLSLLRVVLPTKMTGRITMI
ncbi:unnamed protein product [Zymoseptoria tritici ST99CH_3D1]|nr:unnamed protein product [Zymoseptoria tritici ST99CH_3D1]